MNIILLGATSMIDITDIPPSTCWADRYIFQNHFEIDLDKLSNFFFYNYIRTNSCVINDLKFFLVPIELAPR